MKFVAICCVNLFAFVFRIVCGKRCRCGCRFCLFSFCVSCMFIVFFVRCWCFKCDWSHLFQASSLCIQQLAFNSRHKHGLGIGVLCSIGRLSNSMFMNIFRDLFFVVSRSDSRISSRKSIECAVHVQSFQRLVGLPKSRT